MPLKMSYVYYIFLLNKIIKNLQCDHIYKIKQITKALLILEGMQHMDKGPQLHCTQPLK